MSHEVETMAWANEVPWHGLGREVNPDVTVDEMLVAAGLDWQVRHVPLLGRDPESGKEYPVPTRHALIRDKDGKVLTLTGTYWKPIQNREVMEFFRDYTEAMGAKLETAGSLKGGKQVWALANLGEGFMVGKGDEVRGYLLLTASHESGFAHRARLTPVRVVCANTMAMALEGEAQADYRQDHGKEFDRDAAKNAMGLYKEQLAICGQQANQLLKLKVSNADTVRLLGRFFQPTPQPGAEYEGYVGMENHYKRLVEQEDFRNRALKEVLHSVEKAPGALPGTGWGVLNGVTHWADHVAGRSREARLDRAWNGDNARLKLNVNRELLAMAA